MSSLNNLQGSSNKHRKLQQAALFMIALSVSVLASCATGRITPPPQQVQATEDTLRTQVWLEFTRTAVALTPTPNMTTIYEQAQREAVATLTAVISTPIPSTGQIAFRSDRDGIWNIYVLDTTGTNIHRLTDDPVSADSPKWSPSGQQIAFAWSSPKVSVKTGRRDTV